MAHRHVKWLPRLLLPTACACVLPCVHALLFCTGHPQVLFPKLVELLPDVDKRAALRDVYVTP